MRNIILFLGLIISFSTYSNEYVLDSDKIEGISLDNDTYLYTEDLSTDKSDDIHLESSMLIIKKAALSKIQFLQLSNGTRSATMAIKKGGDMGGGGL